jgi:hypothetical protein
LAVFLRRFRKIKKRGRLRRFLKEASVLQFAERLHFVSLKGLRRSFLETALKKTTRPIPFFSDASEFFPEPPEALLPEQIELPTAEPTFEVAQEPNLS